MCVCVVCACVCVRACVWGLVDACFIFAILNKQKWRKWRGLMACKMFVSYRLRSRDEDSAAMTTTNTTITTQHITIRCKLPLTTVTGKFWELKL